MRPRDRRAVIVGGVVVLGALLLLRGVPRVVSEVAQLRGRTIERLTTLERARDALAGSAAERDSLARALARIMAFAPRLVEGSSAAEAQAGLSGLMSLAAGRHAVKIVRLQPAPDSVVGGFRRVTVTAEGEGDVRGLAALLRAVETTKTLLSVPSLSVQALEPEQPGNSPERLRIELTVTGWYLPRGPQ